MDTHSKCYHTCTVTVTVFTIVIVFIAVPVVVPVGSARVVTDIVLQQKPVLHNHDNVDLRSFMFNNGTMIEEDVECKDVQAQNDSMRCEFVRTTDDCDQDEGLINYTESIYCTFAGKLMPLGIVILVVWWLTLFVALAVAADKFFCPSLAIIAKTFRMSDNIAGVTLLAFGNGAPDVFSAIAAVGTMKAGDAGLVIGALVGAGVFVTTVVAGSVAMVVPFHAMERPFLRDVTFYLAAVFMTFYVLYTNIITLGQAIAFIGIYFLYVIIVIVGRCIYKRWNHQTLEVAPEPDYDIIPDSSVQTVQGRTINTEPDELTPLTASTSTIIISPTSPTQEFVRAICPLDIASWPRMKWYEKVYGIFKAQVELVLVLSVPIVDLSVGKEGWNRHLNSLHCITAPLAAVFCAKVALYKLGDVFPVWALTLLLGFVVAVFVYCTSTNDTPPRFHKAFAFLGFITAVIWISAIANEIVNLLTTFGILFNLSKAILGLTFLAWGNSLGDLIADTTMARQGAPRTGISACFGGPLFNLVIGMGIPFTIKIMHDGSSVQLDFTLIQVLLLSALATSLISSLVILPLIRFNFNRVYAIYLYTLYLVFIILAVIIETGVIKGF